MATEIQKAVLKTYMATHNCTAQEAAKALDIKLSPAEEENLTQGLAGANQPANADTLQVSKQNKIQLTKTEPKEKGFLEKTWDYVKEHPLKALGMAVGANAVVGAGVAAVLTGAVSLPVLAALGLGGALLASCSPYDDDKTEINQTVNVQITQNSTIEQALDALLKGQDVTNSLLAKILAREMENGTKLDDIIKLCGENNSLLKQILEAMARNTGVLNDIKNIMETDNNQLIKLMLSAINAINNVDNSVKNNGDDIKALLQTINNNVEKGNAEQEDQVQKILQALAALKFEVVAGTDKIVAAVLAGNLKLDEVISILNRISEAQQKFGDEGIALGNAILDAIGKISINGGGDMSGIEAKLDKILAELVKGNGKMADMTKLLEKINSGVVKNGQTQLKILEAIEKLGVITAGGFNAILDALSKQPNYEEKLDAILNKLGDIDNNNAKNFAAVIDAINKKAGQGINIQPILDKLEEILQAIKDHDVKVTVDVTGKVTCECNCNCGGNHEGILGDLNAILG